MENNDFMSIFGGQKSLKIINVDELTYQKYRKAKQMFKDSKLKISLDLNAETEDLIISNYSDDELLRLGLLVGSL